MANNKRDPFKILGMEVSLGFLLTIVVTTIGIISNYNLTQFKVDALARDVESAKSEQSGYVTKTQFSEFKEQLWIRLDRIDRKLEK